MESLAKKVAISETLNPTLGVTEQVLAVHQLVIKENTPVILYVDEHEEPGTFYVYFAIENEPYYFVIVVRTENDRLIASASYIEAAVRVYLSIHSTLLDPRSITERVQLAPTRSDRIGEKIFPKSSVKLALLHESMKGQTTRLMFPFLLVNGIALRLSHLNHPI